MRANTQEKAGKEEARAGRRMQKMVPSRARRGGSQHRSSAPNMIRGPIRLRLLRVEDVPFSVNTHVKRGGGEVECHKRHGTTNSMGDERARTQIIRQQE